MSETAYQKHYRLNREKHIKRAAKRNKEQYAIQAAYLAQLKSEAVCADCGMSHPDKPWRMSFDHLPGTEKLCDPAALPSKKWSMKRVQAELDKCEIVCLLCHADRTVERRRGISASGNTSPLHGEVESSILSSSISNKDV